MNSHSSHGRQPSSTLRGIQGKIQLFGELVRIERAAGEIAACNLDCGNLPAAIIRSQDNLFRFRLLVDIDFAEGYTPLAKELFRAAAVVAPEGAVNRDISHLSENHLRSKAECRTEDV